MSNRSPILAEAIDAAGGVKALAEAVGLAISTVSEWVDVPPLRVIAVEKASGIPREKLRPDIYQ